jgi:hypothetical protein
LFYAEQLFSVIPPGYLKTLSFLLSEKSMELTKCFEISLVLTCECSGVPCKGVEIAFLSGSTSAIKKTNVRTFLVGAIYQDVPGTREAF